MSQPTTIVFVEHVLWEPGALWRDLITQLSDRFARAHPLEVASIEEAGALHSEVELLDRWAQDAGVDLDRELGRWLDEHLSMHVRPSPIVTRAVRALAAAGRVEIVSALPSRAAESITRHAGCWRSASALHGDVRSAATLAQVLETAGADVVVSGADTPLPNGVASTTLASLVTA